MTASPELEEKARLIGSAFSNQVAPTPMGYTQLLSAMIFALGSTFEVVITGDPEGDDTKSMLDALNKTYIPNKVTLFRPIGEKGSIIEGLAEYTANQNSIDGKATAYVCKNYTCSAPTTDINEMLNLLQT